MLVNALLLIIYEAIFSLTYFNPNKKISHQPPLFDHPISSIAFILGRYFKDIKLKELSLQKILEKMNKTPHVAVGILQDKKVEGSFSIADLAAVHEYSSSNGRIPARSFIRSTFDAKQKKYAKLISDLQSKIIFNNLTIKQALLTLGEVVSKDMVATINKGIKPALKANTIKRKKSTKPLIDTGRLKGSITHEIREGSI